MRSSAIKACGVLILLGAGAPPIPARASDRTEPTPSPRSIPADRFADERPNIVRDEPMSVSVLPDFIDPSTIAHLNQTAGTPPGTTVYQNVAAPASLYTPGANQRIADDLTLANGACNAVYYSLVVYNIFSGAGTYNVHTELWTGDPCLVSSTAIVGSAADFTVSFTADPNDHGRILEVTPLQPIAVPATVWLAVTFSGSRAADAVWLVAGQAETGSTLDIFTENDSASGCGSRRFGGTTWAGFFATVNCELTQPPSGACCNGAVCSQATEAACAAPGNWQGPFSTCHPNVCQPGACCTGVDFETCTDSNESACSTGLFRPDQLCSAGACGSNFEVLRNDFVTLSFEKIPVNQKWGDDFVLGPGAPCALSAYSVQLAGDNGAVPTAFNAHVELWTNNEQDSPSFPQDDIPLAPIAGTAHDFIGLTANGTIQEVLAGPFSGIQLPEKVWMVVTTSVNFAGPVFAGMADVGFSLDGFAIFNNPAAPNVWTPRIPVNGFDPDTCPGAGCVYAWSFRAVVWCAGDPPPGACCNDVSGTCTDGVLPPPVCEGRWIEGATCASAPFNPGCGFHACCSPNDLNPNSIECDNRTTAQCAARNGESAPGLFCVDVPACPRPSCLNKTGECFSAHATGYCENAFCCERVCAEDPFCCTSDWDGTCVTRARSLCSTDNCDDALPIAGVGTFPFDNTLATTDGPPHAACRQFSEEEQISKDIWYCWTAPCTDNVYVRTCGQTTVDTRIAVYEGCRCPVGESDLLDCNDDSCGQGFPPPQSVAVFHAAANRQYLIRVGTFPSPLTPPGTGTVTISCGPPGQAACPTAGNCCADNMGTVGCADDGCCERVCGCDPYCCTVDWDGDCATTGLEGSGCGASILCPATCGGCASGAFSFDDPPAVTVDARRPSTAKSATPMVGIDTLHVTASSGADNVNCWRFCETNPGGSPNGIVGFADNVGSSSLTVSLARPTAPGTLSKVTYLGTNSTAMLIGHPANVNGDGFANNADVQFLVNALNGSDTLPAGLYSGDIDRSGVITGADLLELVGLLNGEGVHQVWNTTARPAPNASCP